MAIATVAGWTLIAKSVGLSSQVEAHTPAAKRSPKTLTMKNEFPYLSKDLFWEAMHDIARRTKLVNGHPWPELKEMVHKQVQKAYPIIHAVQEVMPTEALLQLHLSR